MLEVNKPGRLEVNLRSKITLVVQEIYVYLRLLEVFVFTGLSLDSPLMLLQFKCA